MEKSFLAKSFNQETIQEHTDNLLKELERIKSIYGNINVDWDLLKMACIYHDIGKINEVFQNKIRYDKTGFKSVDEVPHGILSACMIDGKELLKK